jgi:hypothetical protein
MNKMMMDYFWLLVATAVGVFFTLGLILSEVLKLIPVDIF